MMESLNWIGNREMAALGWTLLHFCWQGAAIAVVYALLDRATLRAGMEVRYGLAVMALALMPLAAGLTFVEQQRLVVPHSPRSHEALVLQVGGLHTTLIRDIPRAAPFLETGEIWIASKADMVLPGIDAFWLGGALFLALRSAGGWWQLQRLRSRARIVVPAELEASFRQVAQQLRIGRRVALRVSGELFSPLAMGVWQAAVILPASAILQLSPAQMNAVLAHELAHIRRWDYACNLLQTTVECLLFFHPAVWWVSRCARNLREACCDEVAARSCDDPVVYAEALLQLEEQRPDRLRLAMALRGHKGSLLPRVRRILGDGMIIDRTSTGAFRVAIVSAIVGGLVLGSRTAEGLHREDSRLQLHRAQREASPQTPPPSRSSLSLHRAAAEPTIRLYRSRPHDVDSTAPEPQPVPPPPPFAGAPHSEDPQTNSAGTAYIQGMRDAGYALDLNKDFDQIIAMRSLGITPEYAKAMAQVGIGTPTLHDLEGLKAVGVTPEYISGLRTSGIAPTSFHDVIAERSLGVTPEYAKSIASLGMGSPTLHDLVGLKAQGITPEYAAGLNASGIHPKDLHELAGMKAVGVTPEYARSVGAVGFPGLSSRDLVSLRAQNITPEYARWVKQTFPDADTNGLRQAAVFHIDADFVASAKSHGFTNTSLDKLVQLKISGLLE